MLRLVYCIETKTMKQHNLVYRDILEEGHESTSYFILYMGRFMKENHPYEDQERKYGY